MNSRLILEEHGRLLVSRVASRSHDNPVSDALYAAAADGRTSWTPAAWQELLSDLDSCHDKIRDWLPLHS